MSFLQNLWRDLVDKRLWPVAIVLVLAAVAVPILIGGGSDDGETTAALPTTTGGAAAQAQVAVAVDSDINPKSRAGKSRDPFKALVYAKVPKTAKGASTTGPGGAATGPVTPTTPATPATPASPGVGGSTATSSGSAVKPASPSPTTTTKLRRYAYAMTVQVKRSGNTTTKRNLRAVSYLPSKIDPILTFLGVTKDGNATFLVADGVAVKGKKSDCRPSVTDCHLIEVQPGGDLLVARIPKLGEPVRRFRILIRKVGLVRVSSLSSEKTKTEAKAGTRTARGASTVNTTVGISPGLDLGAVGQERVTSVTR